MTKLRCETAPSSNLPFSLA